MNTTIVNIESVYELATSKGYESPYYMPVNTDVQLYLIQQWLIDIHGLIIWVKPEISEGFEWELFNRSFKGDIYKVATDGYCDTYDECLLTGINEALQLI